MERHEFDAAYARICEVCGMKTQTELSAYPRYPPEFHTWILTGEGSKFLVPASLPPSAPTLLLARLAGLELEQRIRAGLMSATECIAEEIRALAEGKEGKGE